MRIRAAVMYEAQKPMMIEEVELDPPKAGEVLVKMAAAGICHSDVFWWTGQATRNLPVILGHEGSGVVEAVGAGVTSLAPGDPLAS